MQVWRLDPENLRLTFPSSLTCAPPPWLTPTALRAVKKPNTDNLNAKPSGTSDGRDDVDERDVVYHDHVNARPLFPTALTLGQFATRLSVSVCVSVSLSLSVCLRLSP